MDLIVSLNKPKDITSQDAVTKVKRILRARKAGHTGTLDPIATGLLLICINRATRLASYFSSLDKEYKTVMKLGEASDTQDAYGKVISRCDDINIDQRLIEDICESFEGPILQMPPMFSAIKHKGKPLYKLARKGVQIKRKPREVMIHKIKVLKIAPPLITFSAVCSKGTYIRTLCHDIGEKLGTGAHLHELERTAIGPFNVKDSLTREELLTLDKDSPAGKGFYSIDEALSWMPELAVNSSLLRNVRNGIPLTISQCNGFSDEMKTSDGIRIKSPDSEVLAIGSYNEQKNCIKMDVVFA
jgi:tRNA pseudouridine55 synthase